MKVFSKLRWQQICGRDSYDYTNLLQRCRDKETLKKLHAQVITSGYHQNPFVASKLISQYAEFTSNMLQALLVFQCVGLDQRDVLLWNMLIRSYSIFGPFEEAFYMYEQMQRVDGRVTPNHYTFPFVLKACASMADVQKGRKIHVHIIRAGLESHLFVGNGLVSFYAKCKEIVHARQLFDEMPVRDLVSWNSMIAGYSQNGHSDEALMLFKQMLFESIEMPDRFTFASLLPACGKSAALQRGIWIHSYLMKVGIEVDVVLGGALIDMYAKCGCLGLAHQVFERMPERNVAVWSAMIGGYGMHGHPEDALKMFSRMVDEGVVPDGISFVYVLSACSHAGLVEKGWHYFRLMDKYHVKRLEEHYACIVDLLGRAGCLDEAVGFIKDMPLEAGRDVWGALLGACRIHASIELAEQAAEHLFALDPDNGGRYVLLANIYADIGRWGDMARVRKMMRASGVRKPVGCSTIEVDHVTHSFGVEDESHRSTLEIYEMLKLLERVMNDEGYMPYLSGDCGGRGSMRNENRSL